jgi:hypothetical protein
VPLKLELCSIDEKAQSVAVSNIVTSASLADSSDVSYVWAIISRVIVLRCTCSTSSISPSENTDSLCCDLRLFFFETVLWRFSLRSSLSLPNAFGRLFSLLRDHFSKSALHGASVFLLRLAFMEGFRVGERERLLPTGDCERRSCSLNNSVFF